MKDNDEQLVYTPQDPNVQAMMDEFQRAGGMSGVSVRRDRNARIRYNQWTGRTSDYQKHRHALQAAPVPWEGAWDARVYMADGVINDLGDVCQAALTRARVQCLPTEAKDAEQAGDACMVLEKYRELMRPELEAEAEYLWQFGLTNGKAVLQVGWDREVAMQNRTLTMEEIEASAQMATALLQKNPGGPQAQDLKRMAQLPVMLRDPSREEEAIQFITMSARFVASQVYKTLVESDADWLENYTISRKTARQAVHGLRDKGVGRFPAPYLRRNQPYVVARETGIDYFAPPEMTDVQTSPWHAVREWLTLESLKEKQVCDGWDPKWVEVAKKAKGQLSSWSPSVSDRDIEMDDESDVYDHEFTDVKNDMVEVIYFYKRYVTQEGVPQIWCTVFAPYAMADDDGNTIYALNKPLDDDHGLYPFVGYRAQRKRRNFYESMGVPELVGSDQASVKRSVDMLVDRQDVEVNPPWLVNNRLSMRYKAGPGSQIPRRRPTDFEAAPPPTGNPELAFDLIESAERRVAHYWGLPHPDVPPVKSQTKLQAMAQKYLECWTAAYRMILQLIQQYGGEDITRIAGTDPQFPNSIREIQGQFDVRLEFDVKDLDVEFLWKKLEAVNKWVIPADRAGVVDMAQWVRFVMTEIDPSYARLNLRGPTQASQAIFREVKNEVAQMFLGNEAEYHEADPAAQTKLQFLQQIIGNNPKYQEALQKDPRFAAALDKYQQNLMQSVKQDQNKQIGRLGVQPGLEGPQ